MSSVPIQDGSPCPLCESPLVEQRLREVAGDEAAVRLVLRNLPILACETSHRYFPAEGFAAWLLNALVEGELPKIPAGVEKGLVFRKYECGGCGAALPSVGDEPWTFSSTLAWKDAPGFVVDISVPIFQCASCGRDQARSGAELAKLLPSALVHAFKSAGIKAPG